MTHPTRDRCECVNALLTANERRRFLRAGARGLAALSTLSVGRFADAARGDPLRILCSGPAGSIPDLVARAVADQLSDTAGLRAVVDNRPGAAGQISVGALKGAAADGSTLLLAQGAIATVYPYLYAKLGYDPAIDLQPVSLASEMLLALAVRPAVLQDVTTLADFIGWIRGHPAQANIGSPGTGTLPHLLEAMLLRKAGVAWQHVAYSGGPPAVTDLLGGQIAALVLPEGLLRQHHAAGRVRVLATSGSARSAYMPDVPSFVEQGHPELVVKEWFAFFAPGRVPKTTVEASSALLREAIARPGLSAAFARAGMTAVSSLPSTLSARIISEQQYWQPVLQANDIRVD
ncbi:MAG: tripartite tricarboxylate transporter substrate-binding protein [Rubrivivax sp.]|nr:tripartite tricarboxylate transporter substrate-binding protein [Rubrivivax sp.]MDH5330889.1 tripartite tricarboxylate transporter substrate-binding protein [Aquincola sp.]